MEISAQYEMTPAEVRRGLWTISPWRAGLFYGLVPLAWLAGATSLFRDFRPSTLIVTAIFVPVMWYILIRAQNKQLKRLAVPTSLTLTDESVTISLPSSTVTHQWSAFVRLASAKDFWLFYTNKQCAVIVPKRAFDAERRAQIEEFAARPAAGIGIPAAG